MRLRFAPSPTGSLHLGNARTALVNWIVARQVGGTLVLRIEDTDAGRHVEAAAAGILEDLAWMGLDWDEGPDRGGPHGPYRQSERGPLYARAVEELLDSGRAYPCFCSPEALAAARDAAVAAGRDPRYPGTCRAIDPETARRRIEGGEAAAVRLRVRSGEVRFLDELHGETGVDADQLGDFVVSRADGTPTYLLAVVVDDHHMAIDRVIRGQDHLSNTPRQLLLYEALGWTPPRFAHLPLVLGADRSRLSKRHGATSVAAMRDDGVLAEALVNALALLGWGRPEGAEVVTREEILRDYRFADLSVANAAFDVAKLDWLNQQHMARLGADELLARAVPFLRAAAMGPLDRAPERAWWRDAVALLAPSVHRLVEIPERVAEQFLEPVPAAPAEDRDLLDAFAAAARQGQLSDPGSFAEASRAIGAQVGRSGKRLYQPLRRALTGHDHGPELARLVPLLVRADDLALRPEIASLQERIANALGSTP